jgi:hypothetical protein
VRIQELRMKDRSYLINKINLQEQQMLLKLKEIRSTFEHNGIKGTEVEKQFREFLKFYLPRRLNIGEGEIIDRNFNTSNQVDVVVTDENHPFTFGDGGLGLFFIEGTCAVGEIKSVLTTAELKSSLEKARNYKKLKMVSIKNALILSSNDSDQRRFYTTPPFFIFAFESQITLEKAYEVTGLFNQENYVPGGTADGIFILNRGVILDLGDGQGSFSIRNSVGQNMSGWTALKSERILFDFLSWLSVVMPRMIGGSNILTPYLLEIHKP